MATERLARITWSAEQVRVGLPAEKQTVDPSWFGDEARTDSEGWSLICRFDSPPSKQGSPSTAHVRFLVDDAPHGRLRPGTILHLFERGTRGMATVEILE